MPWHHFHPRLSGLPRRLPGSLGGFPRSILQSHQLCPCRLKGCASLTLEITILRRNVFGKKPSNTVYTAVLFEKPAGSLGCSPCCLAFASQQLCNRHVCDSPLSKTVKIPCLDVAKLAQRSTRHWLVRLERLPYISQHLSIRVVIQSLTPVITISIINPGEKSNLSQHIRNSPSRPKIPSLPRLAHGVPSAQHCGD